MKITFEKPTAIIVDFLSTCVKAGFIEKALFRFLRNHGKETIVQLWAKKDFMEVVALVRRQVRKDQKVNPNIPSVAEKTSPMEEQQESLYANMMWYLENNKETDAHYRLKYALYEDAYNKDKVVTHVYTDVARNVKKWKAEGIKIFIFSHAWVNTQRLFMKKTNHGELFSYIDGFHDTHELGSITDPGTFQRLVTQMGTSPADTLFLTKGVAEGRAAKQAGIHAILVISHGHQLKRYAPEDLAAFERIRSFDELIWRGPGGSQVAGGSQAAGGSQMPGSQAADGQTSGSSTAAEEAAVASGSAVPTSGVKSGSKVSSKASGSKLSGSPGSGTASGSKLGSKASGSKLSSKASGSKVSSKASGSKLSGSKVSGSSAGSASPPSGSGVPGSGAGSGVPGSGAGSGVPGSGAPGSGAGSAAPGSGAPGSGTGSGVPGSGTGSAAAGSGVPGSGSPGSSSGSSTQ